MPESRKQYNAKVKISRMMTDGTAQPKWCSVGAAFETTDGQINLVLDTLPVLPHSWDGCIALFERKP